MYHALSQSPDLPLKNPHVALKIYKTSILIFKDRDRYVNGEYRFRRGYSKRNPRKMVRLWAEKEMRNLKRLRAAGIPCPDPFEVRENVLVMSFLGDEQGWCVLITIIFESGLLIGVKGVSSSERRNRSTDATLVLTFLTRSSLVRTA